MAAKRTAAAPASAAAVSAVSAAASPAAVPVLGPRQLTLAAGLVFAVVAILFCGFFFRSLRDALLGEEAMALRALAPEELNRPAADLTFENERGEKVLLSSFRGKPLFVNFWATWCGPCRDEAPSIEAMARDLAPSGLVVLLVSTDDDWDAVRRFYGGASSAGLVLRDPGAAAAHAWGTFKYPETYLVSPDFTVKHRFVGPRNWSSAFALRYLKRLI
jgi:thiol-disulfide isomerase/thioredoxin